MIIVTGGAGFIGSNLIKGLNNNGEENILIVDHLGEGKKYKNLLDIQFFDYSDKEDFIKNIISGKFDNEKIKAIFHLGACTDTMNYNVRYMVLNNYEYSKTLLNFCLKKNISFIYASSASVYGNGKNGFIEKEKCETAINPYAFSKLLFDRYVRKILYKSKSQVVGLRYFNVFGPKEYHKEKMASVIYQFYSQLKKTGIINLFKGIDGYKDGEQKRDFIYVDDVVKVNLFFYKHPNKSGIFNCGTGNAMTFNFLANKLIEENKTGKIKYIDFPEKLKDKYQNFTKAKLSKLLKSGYKQGFIPLGKAIEEYYNYLEKMN